MISISNDYINQTRTLLEEAKEITIALPKSPTFDAVAAALSLYVALSSRGKQITVVCPDQMTVEFNQLVGIDKVKNSLNGTQGKNLVISFPYQEGSIEKVSYNIENATFNLVIEPRENYPVITPDVIQYSYSGGNTDVIITVGTVKLSDLQSLYTNNQSFFTDKPIINIDSSNENTSFGRINIVEPNVSSISELTVILLSQLGLPLDPDTTTNLLAGVNAGSNNFTSKETTAETFEAAAICLKNGARKIPLISSGFSQSLQQSPQTSSFPRPFKTSFQQQQTTTAPQPQSSLKQPFMGTKTYPPKPKASPQFAPAQPQKQPQKEAPPDWLKPKIYKGSTLL